MQEYGEKTKTAGVLASSWIPTVADYIGFLIRYIWRSPDTYIGIRIREGNGPNETERWA